jgi:hypothetical protein
MRSVDIGSRIKGTNITHKELYGEMSQKVAWVWREISSDNFEICYNSLDAYHGRWTVTVGLAKKKKK